MSILHSTRSRPMDSIFLEDGLVSGGSSIPSAAVFGPESAMVNEIFNNPDAWSVQFGVEGHMDSAGPMDVGLISGSSLGSSMVGKGFRERRGENRNKSLGTVSPAKKKSPKNLSQPEGYHLKRGSKLQLESFTLKSYHITPHLSSASSMSDSSSLDSSTPSLNSSLPTISDEDSVDSHPRSLELAQSEWKGVEGKVDRRTDSPSLLALMEPSNTVSPEAGERVSILWSRQSVFHAFPSPKSDGFDSQGGIRPDSQSSTESSSNVLAMASTVSRVERQSSPRVTKHIKRPSLKIATTTTTTTTTTMTTIISVPSPQKASPASVTVLSASATWSILELYGDSPKPSPKGFVVPKTSGHLHSSFKSSDIQLPSRIPLPKSAFASKFTSQQLNPNSSAGSGIVELPADFVIPPSRSKSKLRGPRTGTMPASPLRITMTKQPSPPPLPKKESALSRSRSNGKVRPLPKPPRAHSPPPPVPSLPSVSTKKDSIPPLPKVPKSSSPPAYSVSPIPASKDTDLPQKGKKSALRSRIPPPPLPLDGPLPPLPSQHAPEKVAASTAVHSKEALVKDVPHALEPIVRSRTLQSEQPLPAVTTSKQTDEKLQKKEKATSHLPKVEPAVRTRMPPPPPLSLESPPLPPLPADASPKLKVPDVRGPIETVSREKEVPSVPAPELSSLTPEPDISLKPLRLADVTSSNPARPSRKGVVSPLPSPILDRANVLDTLPERNKLLSPSNPGHRSSASESSLGSAAKDISATLSSNLSPKKTLKKNLRKSSSFASLPKFSPDVPLPDASILAKRTRKDSTLVRPSLEPDDVHILVTPAPEVSLVAPSPNATEAISSTLSLPVPAASVPTLNTAKDATNNGSASSTQGISALQGQQKTDVLSQQPRQGSDQFSFPADRSLVPPSPIHRKGASLSSADVKPAPKTHQKSSSLSFKPLVEPFHPDVGELARRLTTRKNSISTGFRPPFPDARPRLDSRDSQPSSNTMRHSKDDSSSSGSPISVLKSSPEMVILYKPNAEERSETSTDALPPPPSHRDPSTSSSLSSKNTLKASGPSTSTKTLKKASSHSLLQSFESSSLVPDSAALAMRHSRNGSVSVRRPMVEEAALPGPGILAQRVRTPSVLDNRPDVSDAFAPPTSSTSKPIVASSVLPQTGVASTTESDVPLAAPKPIVAAGKWVPQLTSRLAETTKEPSQQVSKSAKPGLAGLRARARSMSGIKPAKVTAPPVPALPSQTIRDSPSLQVPKAPSASRAASPSILMRNNMASPQPSFGHVRFRSIDKHPLPVKPVSSIVDEPPVSLLSQPESSRGAGRPIETTLIKDEERAPSRGRQRTTGRAELPLANTTAEESRPSHERSTESSRGRQRTSIEASPRGRSASATPSSRQQYTRKRAASVAASPRKSPLLPPPLPLSPDILSASDSLASAGSRGRISPFPSRPVSRASEGRSGAF